MRVHKTAWSFVAASYLLGLALEVASTASGNGGPAYSYSPQQHQQWYGQQGQYGEPQQQMQQPEEQQQPQEPEPSSSEESRENLPPLPPGWTEHLDPASDQYYYYNSADGTTTWDRPPPLESPEPKDEPLSPEVHENSPADAASERYEDSSAAKDAGPSEESSELSGMGQQMNFADPVASSFQKDEPTKEVGQSSGHMQPDAWQAQNPGWGMPPGDPSKVPEKQQQPPAGWGLPSNQQQQPPRQINQFDPRDPRTVQQPQQWQQQAGGVQQPIGQQQELGGQQLPSGQQQQQQQYQQQQQHQQQQRGPPQAQGWGMPPGDKPPAANPQSGSPTRWGLPPQAQGSTQQAPARSQGTPPHVQGTPLSDDRHPGMNVPPSVQQQRQNAPQGQGPRQGPPQYQQAGSSAGQKLGPGQQQQPPQQQQPQQQPPRQGNPQQYNPAGQYNPYSQYGSYGQYAANQYGSYGGGPPRPSGQLTTQPIESTVSQALGGAWQGLLGFGKKTTEVVGQAKDTVAAKAAEATQTLSATSSNIAKTSVGSFFEGGSSNDPKQGGYSLSGNQQPPQGSSGPPGGGPSSGYPQLGYPPQGGYPPRGYPQQVGQPQPPQGQRAPPGYPQQQPPRGYQPRQDPAYPQPGQPQSRVQQPMQNQWGGAGAQGYPPQQGSFSPQGGYPPRQGQYGQGQQAQRPPGQQAQGPPGQQAQGPPGQQGKPQGGQNNNQAPANPWNHPGLGTEY